MPKSAAALFNTTDNEGKTPAHHAAENGHADSLRIVLHNGGGNLSAQDEAGCTPAHYASMNGHEGCLTVLLDFSADVRVRNANGHTPLRLALRNNHMVCATLLRAHMRKLDPPHQGRADD
mmetsp:Transcript_34262/g.86620  ORF Transcript_34262/g.86620 Transcript_34262/m.86620 type:complete len:120 (+) Transcript_34262:22-381(+)